MEHTINRLQLVGVPGSNKVMAGELSRLCRRALTDVRLPAPTKLGTGAVAFPFDARVALVAARYHRTSSRVLWDLYQSRAQRLESLYEDILAAASADRRAWAQSGARLSIRPRNLQGFPAGVRQVVGAVKNALLEGAAARGIELEVDAENPDLEIAVRRHDDVVGISLDIGGGARHQRGYRLDSGEAPLRENLAAVLLMLARYDARRDVLVDPMAGSGTIAIEAALMASAAPLWKRQPAFASWPVCAGIEVPDGPLFADAKPRIMAIDIDGAVLDGARANCRRAGVDERIELLRSDFRAQRPPVLSGEQNGLIVTNPPYGRRLQGDDLEALYRDFARWASSARGYRTAVLVEDPQFERIFGKRPRIKKPLANASARTYFYLFE